MALNSEWKIAIAASTVSWWGLLVDEKWKSYKSSLNRDKSKYLLTLCDWIDRNWVIHTDKKTWMISWFPEKMCVRKIENTELDRDAEKIDSDNLKIEEEIKKIELSINELNEINKRFISEFKFLEKENKKIVNESKKRRLDKVNKVKKIEESRRSIIDLDDDLDRLDQDNRVLTESIEDSTIKNNDLKVRNKELKWEDTFFSEFFNK